MAAGATFTTIGARADDELTLVARTLRFTDATYPGALTVSVDATDLDRRIFRVRETVPVKPGKLTLYYPRWLPGHHAPNGRIAELAGLQISASGKPLAWVRDPLDVYAFNVDVPSGTSSLDLEFEHVSPVKKESGRVVMTPDMLNVQWNAMLLYPAGYRDHNIRVTPSLRLPDGWELATGLETTAQHDSTYEFKTVNVYTLIDSPVLAGRYMKRVDLDPDARASGRAPVFLDIAADAPSDLDITPEQIAAHRALVAQAASLYGARHFAHYDFLLSISDQLGGIGLEHHQSSEDGVRPGYFANWNQSSNGRDLLPHEFNHSWDGKFRRGVDLATPNTNVPMQDGLLWMYEGQTQFWGDVLAVRSGLVPMDDMRDTLADVAAWYETRGGRVWRNLQDTTNTAIFTTNRAEGRDWGDWQRGSDYYDEMVMVWLEADMLIRDKSNGAHSLDDFAHLFFGPAAGMRDTDTGPLTYRFEDIVKALDTVQPYDWARFLRDRLDSHAANVQPTGLERSGWRLAWSEEQSKAAKARAERHHSDDFEYSLGIQIGAERDGELATGDQITSVKWGSPAFNAGLSTAVQLVAIDGIAYKADRLRQAITAAKTSKAPIQMLVKDGESYRTVSIAYSGGLRYPKLERIEGTEDRLTKVLSPRS